MFGNTFISYLVSANVHRCFNQNCQRLKNLFWPISLKRNILQISSCWHLFLTYDLRNNLICNWTLFLHFDVWIPIEVAILKKKSTLIHIPASGYLVNDSLINSLNCTYKIPKKIILFSNAFLAEHWTCNPEVVDSNPTSAKISLLVCFMLFKERRKPTQMWTYLKKEGNPLKCDPTQQ